MGWGLGTYTVLHSIIISTMWVKQHSKFRWPGCVAEVWEG